MVKTNIGNQLQNSPKAVWRSKVLEEAKSWIGTPFMHHTLHKGLGVDCGMFIMGVFSNIGLVKKEIPKFYPEDWAFHKPEGEKFDSAVKKNCTEIKKEDLKPGDVILYKFGKCLSHASIFVEDDIIIHSEKPIGVNMCNRSNTRWFSREQKYYTYKEN